MMQPRSPVQRSIRNIRRDAVTAFALALVAFAIYTIFVPGGSPLVSSTPTAEAEFADRSSSGLAIVPASCPSDPHYAGECSACVSYAGQTCTSPPNSCGQTHTGVYNCDGSCSAPRLADSNCPGPGPTCVSYAGQSCTSSPNKCGQTGSGTYSCSGVCSAVKPSDAACPSCTPKYYCAGSQLYYQSFQCTTSLVQNCTYGCSGSACLPPPSITFVPFAAQGPNGPFQATGHLQVTPQLVRKGEFSYLYWNATNVSSCSVTGTNGDHWTGKFSGESGKQTKPITGQVIYTLNCTALPGATPGSVTESVTVNIVPDFNEL